MHVRGKRGRQVPMLLTHSMLESIDLLIECREKIGVSKINPYVFAAPTRDSRNALRGYQALANVSKKISNLKNPELIKSTELRKYVATVSQIFDLSKNKLEWLANHMGHNLDVHYQ